LPTGKRRSYYTTVEGSHLAIKSLGKEGKYTFRRRGRKENTDEIFGHDASARSEKGENGARDFSNTKEGPPPGIGVSLTSFWRAAIFRNPRRGKGDSLMGRKKKGEGESLNI